MLVASPAFTPVAAQDGGSGAKDLLEGAPFVVDVRVGGSVGELASAASGFDFEPGPALSVSLLRDLRPNLRAYGRYARSWFGCRQGFCSGADVDLGGHGLSTGVEWSPAFLRFEGGLVLHSARASWEWNAENGEEVEGSVTSDWGAGFEVGTGLEFAWADRFVMAPGLRYLRFRSDFEGTPAVAENGSEDRMTWLALDVGIRIPVP